jgi:hypothetical protein
MIASATSTDRRLRGCCGPTPSGNLVAGPLRLRGRSRGAPQLLKILGWQQQLARVHEPRGKSTDTGVIDA